MPWLLNTLYLLALLAATPWLLYRSLTTGRYRRGFLAKLLGAAPALDPKYKVAWFHGVSVGEIHLLRQVVAAFRRRHPLWDCVLSTTTDTGRDEAQKCFPDLPVFYWPLDFTWAVRRALRRVRPSLVVLAEGELWPNFLRAAEREGVPVAVVNGRMSPRSQARYRRLGAPVRRLLTRLELVAVQTEEYATLFRALGAANVHVTGSVKYDGVEADRTNRRTTEMRHLLGIGPDDLVLVAGSTQTPEEALLLDLYPRLKQVHPTLRLLLVPRQRDRFDEVAALLERTGLPHTRRSLLPDRSSADIVLVDSIGELSAVWGLADVAFVGGSLDGKRGGQNMIEPAAYGAAVVFGPHVWNFRDTAARLVEVGGAVQVGNAMELGTTLERLLADPAGRAALGAAGRALVSRCQGATERTVALLDALIAGPTPSERHAA